MEYAVSLTIIMMAIAIYMVIVANRKTQDMQKKLHVTQVEAQLYKDLWESRHRPIEWDFKDAS